LRFHKLHGLGNDFVVVDALDDPDLARRAEEAAPALCHRALGIGSDGVLIAVQSERADFEMIMVNPDGTRGMCGNGLRCFARFLSHVGRTAADRITVDTIGGVTTAYLFPTEDPASGEVEVDMGPPALERARIPMRVTADQDAGESVIDQPLRVGDETFAMTCVSMGNPHCVIFVPDPCAMDLARIGPLVEHHEEFPERTNVHLVQVVADDELFLRVWERGAGLTLACGTGACAATVAGAVSGRSGRKATVHMPGGDLRIHWLPEGNVMMRGPAVTAFVGEIELDRLPRL
jgi:diaminopimelate epimerase